MTGPAASAPTRPGNHQVRLLFSSIIVFSGFVVAVVGLAGALADEVTIAERLLLLVINPVAAMSAVWAMLDDAFFVRRRLMVALAALVAVIANLITAASLYAGWTPGDGEIPLILAIPSVAFLAYHLLTPGPKT